ncbi:MAG: hypothetical protein ACLUIQ_03265 [Dialister invisus]
MMKYVYGRKKWLAAGIAALLISGTGAVSMCWRRRFILPESRPRQKDKATFGSAYKVETVLTSITEDGSKISIHDTYHAEGITPGKGRHPLSPWVTGQERCPLILPAAKQEIRRGRGFSHLTGAG